MEIKKVSHEEYERIKKLVEAEAKTRKVKELSDDELDKVAGGYFCDPGTIPFGNACISEDDDW